MSLLNVADAVYLGGKASAVYLGAQKVWPSGPPDPWAISGCVLGLDAYDVPEGAVTWWPDRSPRNNDLVPWLGSPTASGEYVTVTTNHMLATSSNLGIVGAAPFHLVMRMRTRAVGGSFLGWGDAAESALIDLWNYNPGVLIWHGYGGGNDTVAGAPALVPGEWHTVELMYQGGVVTVRVDDLTPATASGRALNVLPNQLWLGRGRYNMGGDFDFSGLYIYDRVLTGAERDGVLGYLTAERVPPLPMDGLTVWVQAEDFAGTSWPNKGSAPGALVVGSPVPTLMPVSLNDKPAVRFKVNEGRVRGTGLCVDGTFDLTVIYVGRLWGSNWGRIWTNFYPPYNFLLGTHVSSYDACYDNGWIGPTIGHTPAPQPWRMWGYVSTAAPREARFYVNGVEKGLHTLSTGHDNRWHLSGYGDSTEETCDAEVVEVLSWNRALSLAERQQVEGYLIGRYGAF